MKTCTSVLSMNYFWQFYSLFVFVYVESQNDWFSWSREAELVAMSPAAGSLVALLLVSLAAAVVCVQRNVSWTVSGVSAYRSPR